MTQNEKKLEKRKDMTQKFRKEQESMKEKKNSKRCEIEENTSLELQETETETENIEYWCLSLGCKR